MWHRFWIVVLHSYKITRFSNPVDALRPESLFYTLTKLQGSQTAYIPPCLSTVFYTLTKLQGSQTVLTSLKDGFEFYTLTKLQGSQT